MPTYRESAWDTLVSPLTQLKEKRTLVLFQRSINIPVFRAKKSLNVHKNLSSLVGILNRMRIEKSGIQTLQDKTFVFYRNRPDRLRIPQILISNA